MSPAVTKALLGLTEKKAAKLRVLTMCDLSTKELELILYLIEMAMEFGDISEDEVELFSHNEVASLWKKLTNAEERADVVVAALKKGETDGKESA